MDEVWSDQNQERLRGNTKETDEQLEKGVFPFVYWSTYAVANHDERADTTKGEDDEIVLICRQRL